MPNRPRNPAISYSNALGQAATDKRVEILRLIGASGSISQAARDAGVSYKAAWQAIDTLTNLAGVTLVEREVGGSGGGGARVTAAGLQLLAAADALEQARQQVLERLRRQRGTTLASLAHAGGIAPALAQLSVRTSMRNQLPCVVQALQQQGQVVRVLLRLAGAAAPGATLVSRITVESVQLLGLREALPVLALCKAMAVAVRRATAAPGLPGVNALPGRATRVARGPLGDEVAARIDAGLQVVGFAAPASGLRAGSRVEMMVEESALVIALTE
ncbi:MAG TPA: TOBE domain-containing protein [Rhodoferax sp.]|nr:TOBE domain-containing protein [Rhodoferax sp.]